MFIFKIDTWRNFPEEKYRSEGIVFFSSSLTYSDILSAIIWYQIMISDQDDTNFSN